MGARPSRVVSQESHQRVGRRAIRIRKHRREQGDVNEMNGASIQGMTKSKEHSYQPMSNLRRCSNTSRGSGLVKISASCTFVSIFFTWMPSLELIAEPSHVMWERKQWTLQS